MPRVKAGTIAAGDGRSIAARRPAISASRARRPAARHARLPAQHIASQATCGDRSHATERFVLAPHPVCTGDRKGLRFDSQLGGTRVLGVSELLLNYFAMPVIGRPFVHIWPTLRPVTVRSLLPCSREGGVPSPCTKIGQAGSSTKRKPGWNAPVHEEGALFNDIEYRSNSEESICL